MIYILFISIFLLGIIFPKNRLVGCLILSYMLILMAFNTHNPDLENYRNMYNAVGNDTYGGWISDIGYIYFVKLSNYGGLNFQEFQILFFSICIGFLFNTINRYCKLPNLALVFIMLYPLFINIIQIRTFLGILVILFSLQYLLKNKVINIIKFLLCLVVASSLHIGSIFFSVLLVLFVKNKKNMLLIGVLIFLIVLPLMPIAINEINSFTVGKLDSYAEGNYITLNKVVRTIFLGGSAIFLVRTLKSAICKYSGFKYDLIMANVSILILTLSAIAILFSNEFERFSRLGYILCYILYLNVIINNNIPNRAKANISILFFTIIPIYIFFQYFFRASDGIPFYESVFKVIMENNSFLLL